MCFEQHESFVCGHRKIVHGLCEYAATVDNPFWLRVACENFTLDSSTSQNACGIDGWYCKESKDGKYLEELYTELSRVIDRLRKVEEALVRLKLVHTNFNKSADDAGITQERRQTHWRFGWMKAKFHSLLSQRSSDRAAGERLKAAGLRVWQYYQTQGALQSLLTNFTIIPPFVDLFGRPYFAPAVTIPIALVNNAAAGSQHLPQDETIDVQPRHARQTSQLQQAAQSQNLIDHNETIQSRGRPTQFINQTTAAPAKRQRKSASPVKQESPEKQLSLRRSARVPKRKVNYMESSDVETSSRAPSPGESDVSGFSPSKSDASASPERSERSEPLRKRGRPSLAKEESESAVFAQARTIATLGARIDEWRAQRRNRPQPAANDQVKYETGSLQPGKDDNRPPSQPLYQVPAFLARTQSGNTLLDVPPNTGTPSRPPTRHGPPQQQSSSAANHVTTQKPAAMPNFFTSHPPPMFQAPFHAPYHATPTIPQSVRKNGQHPATPPLQQYVEAPRTSFNQIIAASKTGQVSNNNWSMNTPTASASMFPSPGQLATSASNPKTIRQRVNSLTGRVKDTNPDTTSIKAPAESPYDRMRRSINAGADLTPPSTTNTPPSADPRKRKMPASSPLVPSNKRPRLSFPGDSPASPAANSGVAFSEDDFPASSPPKMQSQVPQPNIQQDQTPGENETGDLPTPST